MNSLKEELARKKKEMQGKAQASSSGGGAKFFRRGDLMRDEEEKRRQEQGKLDREREEARRKKEEEEERAAAEVLQLRLAQQVAAARRAKSGQRAEGKEEGVTDDKETNQAGSPVVPADGKLPPEELNERLRALGQPIILFGETEEERLVRLRHAENEDPDLDYGLGGGFEVRNQALDKRKRDEAHGEVGFDDHHTGASEAVRAGQDGDESSMDEDSESESEQPAGAEGDGKKKRRKEGGEGGGADGGASAMVGKGGGKDVGQAPKPKKPMSEDRRIYKFFRGLLKQWEADLNARPDPVKRSVAGKLETKTQKQCKDYIRPLFKLCKAKQVPEGIRFNIIRMIDFCEDGEFVKAQEEYLRAAIGNSPWPIGLTMVGIHERTGRERISTNKVAHIMNNEMQRKYLTSVKRLMRFLQDKRPDVLPSKKVL